MGKMIYEHPEPIVITPNQETLDRIFNDFVRYVTYATEPSPSLGEFLTLNKDGFFANKVVREYRVPETGEVIGEGMKLGKALKFFSSFCDAEFLEWARLEMSRLVQENKFTGKLCISVHPLDFLSASENNHNWRSCHALDGEYCAGNMTYMVDNCTVMVYIKSDKEDVKLPRFPASVPWNDKRWRCLFFFDRKRKIVWAGRQYPFRSDALLYEIVNKLFIPLKFFEESIKEDAVNSIRWESPVVKNEILSQGQEYNIDGSYVVFNGAISPIDTYIQDSKDSLAFNDLLHSSFYVPMALNYSPVAKMYVVKSNLPMVVGGPLKCTQCGEHTVRHSESMVCDECLLKSDRLLDDMTTCQHCGAAIFEDYDYSDPRGGFLCEDCYREHVHVCESCGERFFTLSEPIGENILCCLCRSSNNSTKSLWKVCSF